jgi:hypothetical protein
MNSYGKAYGKPRDNDIIRLRAKSMGEIINSDIKNNITRSRYVIDFGTMNEDKCQELHSVINGELRKIIIDYKLTMEPYKNSCFAAIGPDTN